VKAVGKEGAWRVTALARREIAPPSELLVHRVSLGFWQRRLGGKTLTMLVNSENINNGTCGLARLPFIPGRPQEPRPESHWFTVLGNPSKGRYALLGFLSPVQHRTFLRLRNGFLECGCRLQRVLRAGERFVSDAFVLREGTDPHLLVEQFGDDCARRDPPRPPVSREVGWNSWDYYFSIFDEHDLDEQLAALRAANRRLHAPVSPVVIDMGWYTDFGDWRANGRFPSGIEAAARKIRAAGFTPGLWLAPVHVGYMTPASLRQIGLCATDHRGRPVVDDWEWVPVRWVDPTHPLGRGYLVETFRRLRKAGFRYFKLDFLHYLLTHRNAHLRRFWRDRLGRMEILRQVLRAIREGAGEDAFIVACGCPPEATVGAVDACRIGGDTSTYFSTTKVQARFLASRYWMNSRLFVADPDFLIVRGAATARDRHHNPCHPANMADAAGSRSGPPWVTLNEPRIWATLVAMSGGLITLADHLGRLNGEGFRMLKIAMAHASDAAARPLDLMERPLPRWWLRGGERPALAVVNWEDRPVEVRLPVERWPALEVFLSRADLWHGLRPRREERGCSIRVPAHDVAWFVHSTRMKPGPRS
jgi:alpha-galactosidase